MYSYQEKKPVLRLTTNTLYLILIATLLAVGIFKHTQTGAVAARSHPERDFSDRLDDRKHTDESPVVSEVIDEKDQWDDLAKAIKCDDCTPFFPKDVEKMIDKVENFSDAIEEKIDEYKNEQNGEDDGTRLTLRELGLLQLAAHDFFNVDRDAEVDNENGELDLSTLLDHGYENIAIGGEPRNRENIILFSVARKYGQRYLRYIENGKTEHKAHEKMVKRYHKELEDVYEKLFDEDLPDPKPR